MPSVGSAIESAMAWKTFRYESVMASVTTYSPISSATTPSLNWSTLTTSSMRRLISRSNRSPMRMRSFAPAVDVDVIAGEEITVLHSVEPQAGDSLGRPRIEEHGRNGRAILHRLQDGRDMKQRGRQRSDPDKEHDMGRRLQPIDARGQGLDEIEPRPRDESRHRLLS